jgi:hypothetical protein
MTRNCARRRRACVVSPAGWWPYRLASKVIRDSSMSPAARTQQSRPECCSALGIHWIISFAGWRFVIALIWLTQRCVIRPKCERARGMNEAKMWPVPMEKNLSPLNIYNAQITCCLLGPFPHQLKIHLRERDEIGWLKLVSVLINASANFSTSVYFSSFWLISLVRE